MNFKVRVSDGGCVKYAGLVRGRSIEHAADVYARRLHLRGYAVEYRPLDGLGTWFEAFLWGTDGRHISMGLFNVWDPSGQEK